MNTNEDANANNANANAILTVEELKQFHTIDREMYRMLIFSLSHDPLVAIRIMSFWIWLEACENCQSFMLNLHALPITLIHSIALETITCLHCLDDSSGSSLSMNLLIGIPCLIHMVNNDTFSLTYLFNNSGTILERMHNIANNVCFRAFDDLLSQHPSQRQQNESTPVVMGPTRRNNNNITNVRERARVSYHEEEEQEIIVGGNISTAPMVDRVNSAPRMSAEEERTILLTFSEGCSLTKTQLIDFFVGRFGEIIEDLTIMVQPAGEEPQPPIYAAAHAKMVVRSSNEVTTVLGGQNRVKFTINEQHQYVYARKYVKRNNHLQASTSSSSHHHSPRTT